MEKQIRIENTRTITEGEATRLLNEAIQRQQQLDWVAMIAVEGMRGEDE